MSKRTIKDYIREAFFARDKASLAQIVKDAEGDNPFAHAEPDGDEGTDQRSVHVHVHQHGNSPAEKSDESSTAELEKNADDDDDASTEDSVADKALIGRVSRLETGMRNIDRKLSKITDALGVLDETSPVSGPAGLLGPDNVKVVEAQGEGMHTTPEAAPEGSVGESRDQLENLGEHAKPAKDTDDEGNALVSEELQSVSPELMEADPSLNTGRSHMGDAEYKARVFQGTNALIRETRARAAVLAPGLRQRAFDAAVGPKIAQAAICNLRRAALDAAFKDDERRAALGPYVTADGIKRMSCDAIRVAFLQASDNVRAANNAANRPSGAQYIGASQTPRAMHDAQAATLKSINEKNKAFWSKQNGHQIH